MSAIQNEFDSDNAVNETASNLASFVKKSKHICRIILKFRIEKLTIFFNYLAGVSSSDTNEVKKRSAYPKIIYASRTHSQLTQVVKELKMTQYNNIKAFKEFLVKTLF